MLSFIVPAYNEELELPSTIEAIHNAALATARPSGRGKDRQHEIIVVDDASTDWTAKVAQEVGAKVVSINRRQIAAARNAGARAALGEILFFVDADTRINQKHVSGAIAALEQGCAGGGARIEIGGKVPLWASIFTKAFCVLYFGLNLAAGAFLSPRETISKLSADLMKSFLLERKFTSASRCERLVASRFCANRSLLPAANCECIRPAKSWVILSA